jgi:hypothetical protein
MKTKQTDQEKTIVIDIKLTKGLVVALSCVLVVVGLLAYLMLTGKSAAASEAETAQAASTGMRQFYVTTSFYTGTLALTACAPGYHMASIWEIADPSNLKYNTVLGGTWYDPDSGQGPPALFYGWVRTGYVSSGSDTVGEGNCKAWSSSSQVYEGTVAALPSDWTAGTQDAGVWDAVKATCSTSNFVWCIED